MRTNAQEAVLSAYIAPIGKRTPRDAAQDAAELCRLADPLNGRECLRRAHFDSNHLIPEVRREDIEFPADKKRQDKIFFFDADAAARIINAAAQPFKLMFLIAALCGLRIGEVTAMKVASSPKISTLVVPSMAFKSSIRLCSPQLLLTPLRKKSVRTCKGAALPGNLTKAVMRIISARKTTPGERKHYDEKK